MRENIFSRTELLAGHDVMRKLSKTRVIIFGVGGVGSWCAETLIRSGIQDLTIVDFDKVCTTNINRQLMATTKTVGTIKVEALKARLEEINPNAKITAIQQIYSKETAHLFKLDEYDYTIDAIDSLKDKSLLILNATASHTILFSSMGAALKIDATKIAITEFWKVNGDPLGAAIRKKFRKEKVKPAKKFLCVYSTEVLPNLGKNSNPNIDNASSYSSSITRVYNEPISISHTPIVKAQINGTFAHITAIFGMQLSGLVLQDIYFKTLAASSI